MNISKPRWNSETTWPKPSYKSLEDSYTRLRDRFIEVRCELVKQQYRNDFTERIHKSELNDIADELVLHNCGKRCRVCTVIKRLRSTTV